MQANIKKEQFILLCNELEQETITLEQFNCLSNEKSFDKVKKIIEVMKQKDLVNKHEVFAILAILISEYKFDMFYSMFQYKEYRTDRKRQCAIYERLNDPGIYDIIKLLQYDFYFYDQEFLTNIPVYSDENKKEYQEFINRVSVLCDDMQSVENSEFYKLETVQKLVKKVLLELDGHDSLKDLIRIMHLDGMLDRTIWFEYLTKIYNKNENQYYPYTYNTLAEELIKNNRMDEVTKKIEEIDTLEKTEEEKIELVSKFLNNIASIRDDILENCSDDHFNFLLDKAVSMEIPFYHAKEMIDIAKENKLPLDDVSKFLDSIEKVEKENTRSLFMQTFMRHPNLINGFGIQKVEKSDYEEAFALLTEEAIKQNDEAYIEKGKQYFGETFSNTFVNYINKGELTKEELLEIRDKILLTSSNFDKTQKTFIVDTENMIHMPIMEEVSIEYPSFEELEEKIDQPKSLWKRLQERFTK